jgi:zinc D-Ala-D-Ala carboxypeptidase
MVVTDWSQYPNFTKAEFDCRPTGKNLMQDDFMAMLQTLREAYARPMRITSGYRDITHPVEARKTHSHGEHTQGRCADVATTSSADRFELVRLALEHGFTRIGIAKNFVHLGIGGQGLPERVMWDYI